VAVVVIGLVITLGLTFAAKVAHDENEERLLDQRVKQVSLVLTAFLPSIQAPVNMTAGLVATPADVGKFNDVMGTQAGPGKLFASAALFQAGNPQPIATIGAPPALLTRPRSEVDAFLRRVPKATGGSVKDMTDLKQPLVGFGYTQPGGKSGLIVYAELALPTNRTVKFPQNAAFADINFSLRLDTVDKKDTLVFASTADLPLHGHTAVESSKLGDSTLRVKISSAEDLGGALLESLPWIVLGAGLLMTAVAAALTAAIQRRRGEAERLAAEVTDLYAEQRAASLTLQQSLLPRQLPEIAGLEVAVRYSPGVSGTEVGGDWYEVVDLGRRTLLVVGDVSGRGLPAASVMAAVRHSVRAYAMQGDSPETILRKANQPGVIDLAEHFATVLVAVLDRDAGTLEVATAGHPPPVIVNGSGAHFADVVVGRPIGAPAGPGHQSATTSVEQGVTVMLFTDGLYERRGEPIDAGLERLRQAAGQSKPLDDLVDAVFDALGAGTTPDDAAMLAVRWTS
jgi:serine phosphatase RsbU (regulator of sigma subunit)